MTRRSTVTLVAVQLASAQLTPRIIALVFREPAAKYSMTFFVFTFTLSLAVLVRITTTYVPTLTTQVTAGPFGQSLDGGLVAYPLDQHDRTRAGVAAGARGRGGQRFGVHVL